LVKTVLITPFYLSVAWVLMVSYQIFTQTAVSTVVSVISPVVPVLGSWLIARMDIVVFVYSFAWVFVLSSIIPSLLLGKDRGVMAQFIVCLTLALTGIILIDVLDKVYSINLTNPEVLFANPATQLFTNVLFAGFYLALPYIFMIAIDYRGRKKRKQKENRAKESTDEVDSKSEQPKNVPAPSSEKVKSHKSNSGKVKVKS
jgi:cytochrome b subunit of formate dehydrogenase